MGNIPLALVGSVIALWISGQPLSVAALVGFITLTGIATRNGILKISHYINLCAFEGETFGQQDDRARFAGAADAGADDGAGGGLRPGTLAALGRCAGQGSAASGGGGDFRRPGQLDPARLPADARDVLAVGQAMRWTVTGRPVTGKFLKSPHTESPNEISENLYPVTLLAACLAVAPHWPIATSTSIPRRRPMAASCAWPGSIISELVWPQDSKEAKDNPVIVYRHGPRGHQDSEHSAPPAR